VTMKDSLYKLLQDGTVSEETVREILAAVGEENENNNPQGQHGQSGNTAPPVASRTNSGSF